MRLLLTDQNTVTWIFVMQNNGFQPGAEAHSKTTSNDLEQDDIYKRCSFEFTHSIFLSLKSLDLDQEWSCKIKKYEF